jgi:two-component system, sensor histidine kinase
MSVATLLAVEDNPVHQYVLRRFCELFDYDVHLVASGEEAVAAFLMAKYAAILMDWTLPGIDGLECTRQIRALEQKMDTQPIPIIALTAKNEQAERELCLQAGMDDFLSKPFAPEELRKILLRWVYQSSRPNLKILQGGNIPIDISDKYYEA